RRLVNHLSVPTSSSSFQGPDAVVEMVPGSDQVGGRLELFRNNAGVIIQGSVTGLTPGYHGFHVHAKGRLGDFCKDAGGHFNPFGKNHGAPEDVERHAGDLGNVEADSYGVAYINIADYHISLDPSSQTFIGGLAIVIHAGVDDLGRGGNPESLKTGNAGKRSGCGIIQVVGGSSSAYLPPQPIQRPFQPVHRPPQPVHRIPQPVHTPPQPAFHYQPHQPNYGRFELEFPPRFSPPRSFNPYYH
ncbi:Superoxide dismutase [Cu-Zn]-like 4, partial [Homarus americanus]